VLYTKITCYTKLFLTSDLHVLAYPYMLLHAHTCRPLNQKLQQVFIDKHLQGTPPIPTFKEVVGHYLTHVHP
jgi:hypothetical protein